MGNDGMDKEMVDNLEKAFAGDDDPGFQAAKNRWLADWRSYEQAAEAADKRHKEWQEAAAKLKAGNVLTDTARAIQYARADFKKYLMEHAEMNGSFQEAYFTTERDERFKQYRGAILEAVRAHDRAIKSHQFEAHTMPEYDRWRIAERRARALWELTEASMAEIELTANAKAMEKFAESEGMKGQAAEIIAFAYYSKYPMSQIRHGNQLLGHSGHENIQGLNPDNLQRESEIAAQITGDDDLAKPIQELDQEMRDRRDRIPPQRQVELTKQYAEEVGDVVAPSERIELSDPPNAN